MYKENSYKSNGIELSVNMQTLYSALSNRKAPLLQREFIALISS